MFGKQVVEREVIRTADGGILEHELFKFTQARINFQRIFAKQNLRIKFRRFKWRSLALRLSQSAEGSLRPRQPIRHCHARGR
jgi:hypothetical protein